MKKTKIIFLSVISVITLFNSQLINATVEAPQGPGFELYNKASHPIIIKISIVGANLKPMENTIAPNGKLPLNIDLDATITLGIYNTEEIITAIKEIRLPHPDYSCTIYAPGKTKYLTWNPAKNPPLYPQTGRFMGIPQLMGYSGISDSGYALDKNLRAGIVKR